MWNVPTHIAARSSGEQARSCGAENSEWRPHMSIVAEETWLHLMIFLDALAESRNPEFKFQELTPISQMGAVSGVKQSRVVA